MDIIYLQKFQVIHVSYFPSLESARCILDHPFMSSYFFYNSFLYLLDFLQGHQFVYLLPANS